jgi:hypothetical protein
VIKLLSLILFQNFHQNSRQNFSSRWVSAFLHQIKHQLLSATIAATHRVSACRRRAHQTAIPALKSARPTHAADFNHPPVSTSIRAAPAAMTFSNRQSATATSSPRALIDARSCFARMDVSNLREK